MTNELIVQILLGDIVKYSYDGVFEKNSNTKEADQDEQIF